MENHTTVKELVEEGRQALKVGDRARALASLTLATQLDPNDENLWFLRSEATSDPAEATHCLEQVLKLDPNNAQAKQKLLVSRLGSLQQVAKNQTDTVGTGRSRIPALAGYRWQVWVPASIIFLCVVCGLGSALAFFILFPSTDSATQALAEFTPLTSTPLHLPPTWTPAPTQTSTITPAPTPTPEWKAVRSVTIRSGPGTSYGALGTLAQGTTVVVTGRTDDGKYIQLQYAPGKAGWVPIDYVSIDSKDVSLIPVAPTVAKVVAQPKATVKPVVAPTLTPVPQYDYFLGRPLEQIADCSRSWKVVGTVYDAGGRRVNGVLVRIWVANQVWGTVGTGSIDYNMVGYWEWAFPRTSDVTGQVAVVNADGSLRSQPVNFRLTPQCDGQGAVNQIVIDMVGKQ